MNKKKYIYIGIGILAFLLILILVFYFIQLHPTTTYTTIKSSDESCKIEFPNHISYQSNTQENNDFIIDLYSKQDEMFFYISRIEKSRSVNLSEIANDDKTNYLKDKENVREDSGILKLDLKNYTAYEYNFTYYDSSYGKDFCCYVLWIETPKNLYILNLEVITQNKEKYNDIFLNIKNSFEEL